MAVSDLPEEFAAALDATAGERGVFGARLVYHQETSSTNDLAAAAADRGDPEGTTFVASSQTSGRGRLGRTWISPPGAGLYMSTIIRRVALAQWITLAAGVAAADAIRGATGLPVQIKWPNDIIAIDASGFRGRRKLAGVLAEAASGAAGVQHIVLGIGINVRAAVLPPDLAAKASSVEAELGRTVDAGLLMAAVLAALHGTLQTIEGGGARPLLERWHALSPSAHGSPIEWDAGGARRTGVTAGLDSYGALLASTGDRLERIVAGEVRWL
ncbi:MAG: biotin--[acetyl-CoA-carboxylase] ligase [Vicinamibacterales bacterium]